MSLTLATFVLSACSPAAFTISTGAGKSSPVLAAPERNPSESPLSCGNQVNDGGKCVDFSCKTFTVLKGTESVSIPARSADGVCYAIKIFDAISNSPSSLTTQVDSEVLSRNHDGGAWAQNPYQMGKALVGFALQGPRSLKLSGNLDGTDPILVDNFILVGLNTKNATPAPSNYAAYGTRDSTIDASETHIQFNRTPVPLTSSALKGTASVAPFEIAQNAVVNTDYSLDIRALDCGGIRQLSDVYLIFE